MSAQDDLLACFFAGIGMMAQPPNCRNEARSAFQILWLTQLDAWHHTLAEVRNAEPFGLTVGRMGDGEGTGELSIWRLGEAVLQLGDAQLGLMSVALDVFDRSEGLQVWSVAGVALTDQLAAELRDLRSVLQQETEASGRTGKPSASGGAGADVVASLQTRQS